MGVGAWVLDRWMDMMVDGGCMGWMDMIVEGGWRWVVDGWMDDG